VSIFGQVKRPTWSLPSRIVAHSFFRLYFTTFPNPAPSPHALNRLASEPGNAPRVRARPRAGPSATPDDDATYYYFTIDDQLLYLSFYQDWGPLNLAMVYKACILIHELLEVRSERSCVQHSRVTLPLFQDKELAAHRLVLYSSDDPRHKANAALLMALYVVSLSARSHKSAPDRTLCR
jgi:cell division cycle 14